MNKEVESSLDRSARLPDHDYLLSNNSRMIAPDVLKVLACLLVISIHFLWNNQFYLTPVQGFNMTVMVVMRVIFAPCVPLFIITTGYLSAEKPLSGKHYIKGLKTVWLYLLATAVVLVYRVFIIHEMKLSSALLGILSFNTAPYAWYVEMHLGLYLLIPFINILYMNIPAKNGKRLLILTLFVLNSLPALLNVYNFTQAGWFAAPYSGKSYQNLIPQWWMFGYPLTYYLIGSYLREYGCRLSRLLRVIALIATLAAASVYCLWRSGGEKFIAGPWIDWYSPFVLISASLIASLILGCAFRRMPKAVSKAFGYVSGLTLSIFLVSYIFDHEYYAILNKLIPEMPQRLWSYIIIVPAVFLSSLAVAAVIDAIYRLCSFGVGKLRKKAIPESDNGVSPNVGAEQ